jgi:hypothetical protein
MPSAACAECHLAEGYRRSSLSIALGRSVGLAPPAAHHPSYFATFNSWVKSSLNWVFRLTFLIVILSLGGLFQQTPLSFPESSVLAMICDCNSYVVDSAGDFCALID